LDTIAALAARWASVVAPGASDVRQALVDELSKFLGISRDSTLAQLEDATEKFRQEWQAKVVNPADETAVVRFYDESQTEIFDLAQWHASDPIHYRTLVCLDIATAQRRGRRVIDYGSGIGSDAIVFANAGYDVTLADVSSRLLEFAAWRCARRGLVVRTIDLKRERLPVRRFDIALCFDVLEHVLRPFRALCQLHSGMIPGGLLFLHAPFGVDADRPMHVVHDDPLEARMRIAGFCPLPDLEEPFPGWLWAAPQVHEALDLRALDRIGYYLHDVVLPKGPAKTLRSLYRRILPKRQPGSSDLNL
jgi:2-polyprenyl-3-methyl-5-hydroxy-6-metoxy-1,4-benzoquinol methylase